jgi:dolichyl-phosphate beta-glucosyltransferase
VSQTIIVVPCYNEAERLNVQSFKEFAASAPDVRFLFVNDGSTDGTGAVLDGLRLIVPWSFGVLHLERNSGKAEAVRQGILSALAQDVAYVGYLDADLATPLRALPSFWTLLEERPEIDLVMGARVQLLGRHIERKPVRHYLGRIFATGASIVLGLPVYDTQCGAKLFRVCNSVHEAFQQPFCSRWIFDVEILARMIEERSRTAAPKLQNAVYEWPLTEWRDIGRSKVRPKDFVRAALDLLFIYCRYMRAAKPAGAKAEAKLDFRPAGRESGLPDRQTSAIRELQI